MKKVLFAFGLAGAVLFSCETKTAQTKKVYKIEKGKVVFNNICSKCHWETVSPEQIKNIKKTVMAGGRPPFNAPPMAEVSARVKKFYPSEREFVSFVKDYITNPSKEKGVCLPMAFKIFGTMPPIGKTMSDADKEAVAEWLYHRFNISWEEFMKKNPH